MRHLAALLTLVTLAGCSTAPTPGAPSPQPAAVGEVPVEFLLTSAATDFHTHRPPSPTGFRDVRAGYLPAKDGERRYLLCGDFQAEGGTAEWVPFATIKTSGYEQLLGRNAGGYCQDPSIVWSAGDLSAALKRRLDSLR